MRQIDILSRTIHIRNRNNETGTAFMLDGDGFQYVITARHNLSGSDNNLEFFWNGNWQLFPAEMVGHCEGNIDISVLRTNRNFPMELYPEGKGVGTENDLKLGEEVLFYGFPFGMGTWLSDSNNSVALVKKGIVSGFEGESLTDTRGLIFVDGHNNPGFSGGPLVSIRNNNYKFAGVISGYRYSFQEVFDKNASEERGEELVTGYTRENSGILVAHNIQSALDLMD
ncbi:MAG: serine protease [Caldilineaceae bacterium]|nr:serine protease [Caldilineaceae bacterium]